MRQSRRSVARRLGARRGFFQGMSLSREIRVGRDWPRGSDRGGRIHPLFAHSPTATARAPAGLVATHYVIRYSVPVIVSFRDKGTEDLFDGRDTKHARRSCPSDLVRVARRKLDQLNQAVVLGDLRAPPSNRLEKLRGERDGQYSIRINDQWRVCFRWTASGAEDVEIVDYH